VTVILVRTAVRLDMARYSGIQRAVLSLYRRCIRAAMKKPEETRQNFVAFAREEFRKGAEIDKKDFGAIEHLLRKGQRQLEIYENPNIRNIH